MKKFIKWLADFLFGIIIVIVLSIGFYVLIYGMDLWGLPKLDDVQSVSISCLDIASEVKEITSNEEIERALKVTGFLKYKLFEKPSNKERPIIVITYHLEDGTDETISANNTTVWWKDKSYVIKEKDIFVNIVKGLFFKKYAG